MPLCFKLHSLLWNSCNHDATRLNCFSMWTNKAAGYKVTQKKFCLSDAVYDSDVRFPSWFQTAWWFLLSALTTSHSDATQMANEEDLLKAAAHPQWGNTELLQTSFLFIMSHARASAYAKIENSNKRQCTASHSSLLHIWAECLAHLNWNVWHYTLAELEYILTSRSEDFLYFKQDLTAQIHLILRVSLLTLLIFLVTKWNSRSDWRLNH